MLKFNIITQKGYNIDSASFEPVSVKFKFFSDRKLTLMSISVQKLTT